MANKNEFYLGDPALPTVKAQFEFTKEMIKEIKKCTDNILHFAENYFFITNLDEGKMKIKLYKPQKRVIKSLADNRFCILLSSRQAGKTTMMCVYALWNTCFFDDKRVLIVANKEDTAKMILSRIKMAYEQLPNWIKPAVKGWDKTEVVFGNDSSITISTTSATAARGESANVLIVDEMAFVQEHIIKEFWNSVIPIISSSRTTKIFCVSTPNGTGNLFHKIYSGAERGDPDFANWRHERIDWWEIPGRGKKWKEEMLAALAGEGKNFEQEFGNQFIETGQAAVDGELLTHFREISRQPKFKFDDGHYLVWEEPKPNNLYAIGVDVAEGVGQAASVMQIIDITDLANIKQVATYHNNLIDPFHFATQIHNIANQWGRPHLLIERNNCGGQVIDALKENFEYPYIVDYTPEKQQYYNRLGIYSHSNAKYAGVMNMRYWVNSLKVVEVYDIATVQELESFIRYPNGTWKKRPGDYIYDDRVMALCWALFILEPKIAERYLDIVSYDDQNKPSKVKAVNVEAPKYFKLESFFQDNTDGLPGFIGTEGKDDIQDLMDQGWQFMR